MRELVDRPRHEPIGFLAYSPFGMWETRASKHLKQASFQRSKTRAKP